MNVFVEANVYQTRNIARTAENNILFSIQILKALEKFYNRDWGTIHKDDCKVNEEALQYKELILGAYHTCEGKIWITAESSNQKVYDIITILFPDEY